jgi:hypothetical protein
MIVVSMVAPTTIRVAVAVVVVTIANRLRMEPSLFSLASTDLLLAEDLTLLRHLELTLAFDLQLTLARDLDLTLPADLVLVDPIVVVVAVVSVRARTIDEVRVHRQTPRRDFAIHRRRLTARWNAIDPDPAHAGRRHLTRRNPEDSLGQHRGREGKSARGRQKVEFAHCFSFGGLS